MARKQDILVSGSRDCTVRVWNIRDGCCLRTLYGHVAAVRCVQFDGCRIVSGGYDHRIIIWDVTNGDQIHVLEGHTNRVYSLLFDSERKLVVSSSLDTTIW
ncbi:WD domain, g-beta repeat domain-containing protein [Ditylenchus destructor]|uniref:WD domain, g-beta repeat domain-containing protein n=1 Tax=Ditylenchus destructor TaxID=166010 RepID=A0AAD4MWY5_9BILA|nr:WD domain, g-beta repeat domain-containing protein [Ditylenchus destructor]